MTATEQLETEGYLVFRSVYDGRTVDRLRLISDDCLTKWRGCSPEIGKQGGGPESTVMRHLNHTGYFPDKKDRLSDILNAVADPNILEKVTEILGETPLFRATSYFFNPLSGGGDGNWHRDSQFNTSDDDAEQKLIKQRLKTGSGIQMQIALSASEDIEYVPGSHLRWDTPDEYHIRKADNQTHNRSNEMPNAKRIDLAPGDAAMFNPMGLHRGRYHVDRLRRTLMWTYTKRSKPHCDYFSMQPWCLEEEYLLGVKQETKQFFEDFINIYQAFWQTQLRM
ncbi:MAG: phytanoyl-CoA dioxygenase family protein [Gemmatimonadota bacterium]|nr:phytanoyl-CoA dioxygenase family protein [Gemmatimonadota bacterium]